MTERRPIKKATPTKPSSTTPKSSFFDRVGIGLALILAGAGFGSTGWLINDANDRNMIYLGASFCVGGLAVVIWRSVSMREEPPR